jgi:uncharacterized membrane protein YgdD (TMEM256/DUF423 family)
MGGRSKRRRDSIICGKQNANWVSLFSGSLYALVLTGTKPLGIITPIGGVAFLVGWLLIAIAAWRHTA